MSSNQHTKQQVRDGQLCYICEQATPVLVDQVGGHSCQECHDAIESMLARYALTGGYTRRARTVHAEEQPR